MCSTKTVGRPTSGIIRCSVNASVSPQASPPCSSSTVSQLSSQLSVSASEGVCSMEDLVEPICNSSRAAAAQTIGSVTDWTNRYLDLLAESTTRQDSMRNHLVKMLQRGVSFSSRGVQLMCDPAGTLVETATDAGSDVLMRHLARARAMVAADAEAVAEAGAGPGTHAAARGVHSEGGAAAAAAAAASGEPHASSACGLKGWARMRAAVLGAGGFKLAAAAGGKARARDDSCLPDRAASGGANTAQERAVSTMLSMLLSGAVAHAVPMDAVPTLPLPGLHLGGAPVECAAATAPSEASTVRSSALHQLSMHAAPALADDAGDATGDVISGAGTAVSTALKLMRNETMGR
ncbi:hypothetical protein FOA52_011476 [Chlamydomonas sp. UWO 241]|nr:hypothetical protein FOA52_011476 [Chlamydomonas sp. UWO 241]